MAVTIEDVLLFCSRFDRTVRALTQRKRSKPPFAFADEYDVIVNPNGCTNEIEFQLGVQFDLWAFRPADMYQVGDNLAGVNGVFHYTANAI